MVSVGRLIFKVTGVMSNRGIAKNSRKIARAIADVAKKSDGNVEVAEVRRIVTDTIGKKGAKKVQIIDRDAFVKQCAKNGMSEEDIKNSLKAFSALTIGDKYTAKSSVYIAENFEYLSEAVVRREKAGEIAHELQHALSISFGKQNISKRILGKFSFGRKFIDKMSKKINSLGIQDKYTKLYRKAVSNECRGNTNFNEGEIKEFLYSKGILKIGEDKNNARILKALRHMFKDEMNSYAIQSETNKIIGRPLSTKICGNRSQNFKNMVSDLGQESKHISLNRIRKFFGLKPNIAKEQEIALANSSTKKAVNFSISKENVIKDKSSKIFKSETKATDT